MKKILLFVVFAVSNIVSYANYIIGADISYQNIGTNSYQFTLNVYRDCAGEIPPFSYTINYKSAIKNTKGSAVLNLVGTGVEVSPNCASQKTTCNGGTSLGIQKWVYQGNVSFPLLTTDWIISWNPGANYRYSGINNINAGNTEIYLEALLNNLNAPNNSSPIINSNAFYYLSVNQKNNLALSIIPSAENDIIIYKLANAKKTVDKNVSYNSGFSFDNPTTTSSKPTFNTQTGIWEITPTKEEVSIGAIVVEEYRKGILVGSVMSDFLIITKNNTNKIPVFTGPADSIATCLNSKLKFNFTGTDADANQNLTFSWKKNIPNSENSFTSKDSISKASATVQWVASDTGFFAYTITLKDDNCPFSGAFDKTYKIRVNPTPSFSIPNDTLISCKDNKLLNVNNLVANLPITYSWNTGENTNSVSKGPGIYWLKITDRNNCATSDTVVLRSAVISNYIFEKQCIGDDTKFTSSGYAFSQTGADITKTEWNFGDPVSTNNTSTATNPTHKFSTEGSFLVSLRVTDANGCSGDTILKVKICMPPIPNFTVLDSCKRKSTTVPIQDLTTVTYCGISYYKYYFKYLKTGLTDSITQNFGGNYIPQDAKIKEPIKQWKPASDGNIEITLKAVNEKGCSNSITKTMRFRPQPNMTVVQKSFVARCDIDPDTVLLVKDTATVKQNLPLGVNGWKPLTIRWSGLGDGKDSFQLQYTVPTKTTGGYSVKIADQFGCDTVVTVLVTKPFSAGLVIDNIYCKKGDLIRYRDLSTSKWGIKQRSWDFGDGSTPLIVTKYSKTDTLSHNYTIDGSFKLKGTFTDSSGCKDTASTFIRISTLTSGFSVGPSPVCVGAPINISSNKGLFIDSLYWRFGDGGNIKVSGRKMSQDVNQKRFYNGNYIYTNFGAGQYKVLLEYIYNRTGEKYCYFRDSTIVKLFPELKINVPDPIGLCADLGTNITGNKTNGSAVSKWFWKFSYQELLPPFTKRNLDSTTEFVTDIIGEETNSQFKTFTQNANYFVTLKAENTDGCKFELLEKPFRVIKMPTPFFCKDDSCATNPILFSLFCDQIPEVEITDYLWNFGDGFTSLSGSPNHSYKKPGTYNVFVKIENKRYQCAKDTTIKVTMKQVATANFKADSVCLQNQTSFKDFSFAEKGDSIIARKWKFGDGDSSTALNPKHLYANAGNYNVSLAIVNQASGCRKEFTDKVFVKPIPQAGFTVDYKNIVAQTPILFEDSSFVSTNDEITKWVYDFGDNSTINAENFKKSPIHNYPKTGIYTANQIVTNKFLCTDTSKRIIDLNIYLTLPTAFSPNNDGLNDDFIAHYRGIESIEQITLFNRWGQQVWQSSNNKDFKWDGTFNGVEQPNGVYLYLIKAKSFLGEEIIKEGKITIVR